MTTRAQLERKLTIAADHLRLTGERRNRYIFGTLDKFFPKKHTKKRTAAQKIGAHLRRARKAALLKTQANPVKAHRTSRQMNVVKAIQLFERFRLQEPRWIDEIDMTFHKEMLAVGKCIAIEYDTRRNGKIERYRHEFTGKSQPTLASSYDGSQLYFVRGCYDFTDRGIVDRK